VSNIQFILQGGVFGEVGYTLKTEPALSEAVVDYLTISQIYTSDAVLWRPALQLTITPYRVITTASFCDIMMPKRNGLEVLSELAPTTDAERRYFC